MTRHTADQINEVLAYEGLSGKFTWRVRTSSKAGVGETAGTRLADGYIAIRYQGKAYKAHVLAFLVMTGSWPETGTDIDHVDRVRDNNKWSNLRPLTRLQNVQNQIPVRRLSSSGIRGVHLCGATPRSKPWLGVVDVNYRRTQKYFATKDEAETWVITTRKALHPYCPENATQ